MEQNTFWIDKQNIIKLFIQPKQYMSLSKDNFYVELIKVICWLSGSTW